MELLIIGVVTALNLMILKMKLEKARYADLGLDITALVVLNMFFGGTLAGMIIAMIASAIISIYLYFNPPKFFDEPEEEIKPKESGLNIKLDLQTKK